MFITSTTTIRTSAAAHPKPFSMKELVARVGAVSRRGTHAQEPRRGDEIEIEELRLDPRNVQAYASTDRAPG